ncbi:hypothetical protein M9979_05465 [Sphingomonas sp. RP10(2022)]|uniref:Uncharacterized protein n=1 Tax=Sphingomonas liriopis TaxID=2949094 RepID=A0A9X2HND4_9SPHN|nr:hypothetical protein [Sphingomonas liriopis]MCP3734326.1 hypothetical protein [Sphingomonas liriopis]
MRWMLAAMTPMLLAAQAPVPPDMGPVTGDGVLTDRDGQAIGTWSIDARLAGGRFDGTGSVTIRGQTFAAALLPARSYLENGRCVFHWERERARAEIAGPCSTTGIDGHLSAFIPTGDVYSVDGYARGRLAWRAPGRAPAAGVVPGTRLICAYQERIGGTVIGGGAATYALRYSNMGFLELSAGGSYRTAHTAGRWVRGTGDSIRLTSGQFAGAVGRLRPDGSGAPAVYFERDENRTAAGVPIVDIARTACTAKR